MSITKLKKVLASALSAAMLISCATVFASAQTYSDPSVELQSCQLVDSKKTLIAYARLGTVQANADKEVGISIAMDGNFDNERYDLSNKNDDYGKLKIDWVPCSNNDQYVKLSVNINNRDLSTARFFLSYVEDGQKKVYDSNGQQGVRNYSTGCTYGKSGVSITALFNKPYNSKVSYINVNCAPHKGVKEVNVIRVSPDKTTLSIPAMYDKDHGDVNKEDGCLKLHKFLTCKP